jgi:SRSO17 transposase
MSLLEHSKAQALLEDATVMAEAVRGSRTQLTRFLQRYLPLFYRDEQRESARIVIEGRLSGLERKTSEPIAHQAGLHRKPIQHFVGAGAWDDDTVTAEMRCHVQEELGDARAVLVLDPSAFPKKGQESCGVQRQWCGRLGKIDNCQVGVFLAYASPAGHAPLDRRLYLPKAWARDAQRRHKCHVPQGVKFQEKWQIGLEMLRRSQELPHRWVVADDEFGRVSKFRAALRSRAQLYVLDVPCNTWIRALEEKPPRRRRRVGPRRKQPFLRVDRWARQQPPERWQLVEVRAGEKGPLQVQALRTRVQTRDANKRTGPEETLVVMRTLDKKPRVNYALSNAPADEPLDELVRAHSERHRIEEMFAEGNGEVGLDHYEVRSWIGWHHHMTLSLLALWFLVLQKRRVGEKIASGHGGSDAGDIQPLAASPPSQRGANRRGSDTRLAA